MTIHSCYKRDFAIKMFYNNCIMFCVHKTTAGSYFVSHANSNKWEKKRLLTEVWLKHQYDRKCFNSIRPNALQLRKWHNVLYDLRFLIKFPFQRNYIIFTLVNEYCVWISSLKQWIHSINYSHQLDFKSKFYYHTIFLLTKFCFCFLH